MKGPIRRHKDPEVQIEFQNIYAALRDLPIGTVILYPIPINISGRTELIPSDFLLCNGGSHPKESFVELYSLIGSMFGTPTTTVSFVVPNLTSPSVNLAYMIKAR